MKVTKAMHHPELRGTYSMVKFFSRITMNKLGVRLLNANTARSKGKIFEGLRCEERFIPSTNGGPDIRVRIFKPLYQAGNLPGMLYVHGGGMVMGAPEDFIKMIKAFIDKEPCVVVAPDYRKAFEAPYPAPFDDCYDTLLWMNDHAGELNIIADKLIVAGHSAGGGLAAAVTQKATDLDQVKIAFQVPVYPMIDDRQNTVSARDNNSAVWNSRSNEMGWSAYLSDLHKRGAEIPVYAAVARAKNFSKLPPTITFVGELEPFRDETVAYVENLKKEGVPVAFKIFDGCYHAFEALYPNLEISRQAWAFLLDNYADYVADYVYADREP